MKIKTIKIKNFYSFKDVELDFTKYSGLTVIKGKNKDVAGSNGAGKSALVEAVFFGLTGRTIRKSTEDAIVNVQAKKHCQVDLILDGDIRIFRQKKPTKLQLFVSGEEQTKQNVYDTQEYIDELLNTNYKVLLSSMFFGQSNNLSFLECSADDKRNIIKNFLNLDEIFVMRDKIKHHKSEFLQKMKEQEVVMAEHYSLISDIEKKVNKTQKAKDKFNKYDDSVLQLKLDDILKMEEVHSAKKWQQLVITRDLDRIVAKISERTKELQSSDGISVCSKCGQDVTPQKNKKAIEKEINKLKETAKGLEESQSKTEEELPEIPISSQEFVKVLSFKELCRDQTNYEDIKTEVRKKIKISESVKSVNKINYEVMRFWEKAFSQQGMIKYIIRNILDYLNDRINYYLSFLTNSKYTLKFNEELLEEVMCNKDLIQYISLSGGEKRKVNLAVTMALKDLLLLVDKNQTDLLFFDEVAENLDEEGIYGLYSLLEEIKKDRTVFVITHNKYLKTLLYSAPRLSIIKENGISRIGK